MIATVVIGRNEARHLSDALGSALSAGGPVIYVDSDSTDGSAELAQGIGATTIKLVTPPMLSAARGRNAGLEWLEQHFPEIEFVLFLDGDCVLDPAFAHHAASALRADPEAAVIVGHLRECAPAANVYSRLSTLEWSSKAGEIRNFGNLGGIMCARISAIRAVGAFNPTMIAGEDSELGVRLSLAGYRVIKIDAEMASHDNGIATFGAWWKRSVRAGHALAQRYLLNGRSAVQDCRREFFSTILWGLALPLIAILLAWPTKGYALALFGGYVVLGSRIAIRQLKARHSRRDMFAAAAFGVLAKFANGVGLCKYFLSARTGAFHIIEYKGPPGNVAS